MTDGREGIADVIGRVGTDEPDGVVGGEDRSSDETATADGPADDATADDSLDDDTADDSLDDAPATAGPPTTTAVGAGAVVALAATAVLSLVAGVGPTALWTLLAGAGLAGLVGLVVRRDERPAYAVLAGPAALLTGVALWVALVGVGAVGGSGAFAADGRALVAAGAGVAALGAVGLGAGRLSADACRGVARTATLAAVGPVLAVVAVGGWAVVAGLVALAAGLVAPAGPGLHLGTFVLLLGGAGVALRTASVELPTEAFVPADRLATARERLGSVRYLLPAGVLVALVESSGALASLLRAPLGVLWMVVGWVTTFAPLRGLLLALAVLGAAGAVLGRVARWVGSHSTSHRTALAAVAGGLLVLPTLALAGPLVDLALLVSPLPATAGRLDDPAVLVLATAVGGVVAVDVAAGTVLAGLRIGALSDRTAGATLAATGVGLATLGAVLAGLPPVAVFAGTAATLVAWDLGRFGSVLGNEVGREGETRRAELLHVVGSLVVASVAVVGAVVLSGVVGSVSLASDAPRGVALVLALVGVLASVELAR